MSEATKKCKECQSEIPLKAKRCPNCTADQRSWFSRHPVLTILGLIIFVPIMLASLSSDSAPTSTTSSPTKESNINTETETPATAQNWTYETKTDEFSGTSQSFATNIATNKLDFDFPYSGGSSFVMVVRNLNKGKGEEVVITTTSGQFLTYEEYIKVRFDDGEPVTYYIGGSDDGSSDKIFIRNASDFIAKLSNSSTIKIEAPFYNEGRQVIYFNTSDYKGLK